MDFVVLLFSLTLMHLPELIDKGSLVNTLLMVFKYSLFWFVIGKNTYIYLLMYLRKKRVNVDKYLIKFVILFSFMILISYFRTYIYSVNSSNNVFASSEIIKFTIGFTTIILLGFSFFVLQPDHKIINKLKKAIFYAPNCYIIIVVLLYIAGFENIKDMFGGNFGEAKIATFFGIEMDRIHFPMAAGINSFGHLIGSALVINIMILTLSGFSTKEKMILSIATIFCIYALLGTDSRGSLFYASISIFLVRVFPFKLLKKIGFIVFIIPLFPFILLSFQLLLPPEILELIARNPTADISTNRFFIWFCVLNELSNFSLYHLIGFGAIGQVKAGIVFDYMHVFEGVFLDNPLVSSNVHNFVFQQIIDVGYIGTIFSLVFIYVMLRNFIIKYEYSRDPILKVNIALLLYFVFLGCTEAFPTIIFVDNYFIFILIIISNLYLTDSEKHRRPCKDLIKNRLHSVST